MLNQALHNLKHNTDRHNKEWLRASLAKENLSNNR